MKQFTIAAGEAGQRFEKYLKRILPAAGTGFLFKMLRKKNITLNGKRADGTEILQTGDEVRIFFAEETFVKFSGRAEKPAAAADVGAKRAENNREAAAYYKVQAQYGPIRVAYEDRNLLVAEKPAGLLSQKAEASDVSLNDWFLGYLLVYGKVQEEELAYYTPSIANRLDRNTGGLVLCAKTLAGSRAVSEMLRRHTLRKYYQMVVTGYVPKSGRLEGWLTKDAAANRVHVEVSAGGAGAAAGRDQVESGADASLPGSIASKGGGNGARQGAYAAMTYRPLEHSRDGKLTLLEAELETGRTHQLRAQLAAAGHPILGDPKYGDKRRNERYRSLGVHGQLLYCVRVEFPVLDGTKEQMETGLTALSGQVVTAAVPAVFHKVLE